MSNKLMLEKLKLAYEDTPNYYKTKWWKKVTKKR